MGSYRRKPNPTSHTTVSVSVSVVSNYVALRIFTKLAEFAVVLHALMLACLFV